MRFLLIVISMVAVSTLDSEDPTTKTAAWVLFMTTALISTVMFSIVTFLIGRKRDNTVIEVTVDNPANNFVGKALKVEGSGKEPEKRKMTVHDYDTEKLREFSFQRTVLPSLIIIFMHYKFGSVVPLVLQSINSLISLWNFELVRIHLRGHPAVGSLQRPFAAQGMLATITGQSQFGDINGGNTTTTVATSGKRR